MATIEDGSVDQTTIYKKHISGQGNGLFAKQDLRQAVVVLNAPTPSMVALETPKLSNTCYQCFRDTETHQGLVPDAAEQVPELKLCMGCKVVRFCGKVSKW